MSEIRSCEEYVVARIQELEGDLESAEERIGYRDKIIEHMDAEIEMLKEDIKKALEMWEFEIDENKEGQFTTDNLYQAFSKGYQDFYELYVKYMGVE